MTGFLNPKKVLQQLKLKKSMTAADFGSGAGGWAIPLAKILEEGKVVAIDILEEPLSALRGKRGLEKTFNIETIKSNVEAPMGSRLSPNSFDLVLMTNLLFQIEDKEQVLSEAKRILKKGGRILVVDWKSDSSVGPEEGRVESEDVKKIAENLKLEVEKGFEASTYHWGLILVK
jgi:ubiquinone/menaquinone biosynthesis C-methylase UbiE